MHLCRPWHDALINSVYVSHGSLRFIKSIQICKRFSRADWKLVWVSSCMSGRRALECETDGRPLWSRSDSDPVTCVWRDPGFYNRYFSTQLGESDMSGWRQVHAAFKCDGLKFWIYPKDMLRFEDSWDQSRQLLLELLEACKFSACSDGWTSLARHSDMITDRSPPHLWYWLYIFTYQDLTYQG